MSTLTGTRVAFLTTAGYEDNELTSPWRALTAAGASATLVSPHPESVEGKLGHLQKVDVAVHDADPSAFDALVLPGGVANADTLRMDAESVAFAAAFFTGEQGEDKPVAAICHAAWTLIESGVVAGRTLTSYPSLRTDLRNAGARWVDEEVVVDGHLITSRTPADLHAFNARLIEILATANQPA